MPFSLIFYTQEKIEQDIYICQYRVTVYDAEVMKEDAEFHGDKDYQPSHSKARSLVLQLHPYMLLCDPNVGSSTLVRLGEHLRIDSQRISNEFVQSTGAWRNIAIQNGYKDDQWTYSAVRIEKGALLCYVLNHQKKLIGYLHTGLLQSRSNELKYVICVDVSLINKRNHKEKKKKLKKQKKGKEYNLDENELETLIRILEPKINNNKTLHESMRTYTKNKVRIATGTDMVDQVRAVIEENFKGKEEKIVSMFETIFLAIHREMDSAVKKESADVARIAGAIAERTCRILHENDVKGVGMDILFLLVLNLYLRKIPGDFRLFMQIITKMIFYHPPYNREALGSIPSTVNSTYE